MFENCKTLKNGAGRGCLKCAEEQEQLAEWLKELKQLKKDQMTAQLMLLPMPSYMYFRNWIYELFA